VTFACDLIAVIRALCAKFFFPGVWFLFVDIKSYCPCVLREKMLSGIFATLRTFEQLLRERSARNFVCRWFDLIFYL